MIQVLARLPADTNAAVDLRCSLQQGTNVMGETWVYQWSPPRAP